MKANQLIALLLVASLVVPLCGCFEKEAGLNVVLQDVGIKRGLFNLIKVNEFEPGETVTIEYAVKNQGMTTVEAGSLKVVVQPDNLIANESTAFVTHALSEEGREPGEISFKIFEDAPLGKFSIQIILCYQDPARGNVTLDTERLTITIVS